MIPLLICAYRPRYLQVVLEWLKASQVEERYCIYVWDNGDASAICAKLGVACYGMQDNVTGAGVNLGKAVGMRHLLDIVQQTTSTADCYVCMDDDVIVDRPHLDALVTAARRPGLGMIGPRFHPFNTVVPPGGAIVGLDPCPVCSTGRKVTKAFPCPRCTGLGKDPRGLFLKVYPRKDRTVHHLGKVAGTLFAISKDTIRKLRWSPYIYPIALRESDKRPIVYWGEDAALDEALTALGLMNGYLESPDLTPVIHLPEMNENYMKWKIAARTKPPTTDFFDR